MSGWVHSDPRGLDLAIHEAGQRVRAGKWDGSPGSIADVRAVLAGCAIAAASLTNAAAPPVGAPRVVLPDFLAPGAFPRDRPENAHAAGAFLRMAPLLFWGRGAPADLGILRTAGSAAPASSTDARGFDFWDAAKSAGELAILGPMGAPIQFAWAAIHAQQVAAELSGAQSDIDELTIYCDALRRVVAEHQAAEAKAGRPLPWSEPELRALRLVLDAQEKLARRRGLGWLIPTGDPLSFLRPVQQRVEDGLMDLLGKVAIGAGIALVGWIALETYKR